MQSVDQDIDRSFQQRPDLKEQIARFRAAEAGIKEARSAYFPSLGFSGTGGAQRQNGHRISCHRPIPAERSGTLGLN